jgi:hypothetical protein
MELFQQLKQGTVTKWLDFGETEEKTSSLVVDTQLEVVSDLMTPFAPAQGGGLLSSIPVLSFDGSVEASESGFLPDDLDPAELAAYIRKF